MTVVPRRSAPRSGATLVLCAVLAALLASGCGSLLSQSYPQKKQYVLEASRAEGPSAPRVGKSLVVRPFRASPRLDGVKFVYRVADEQYQSDFYHVFWTAPEAMVGDQTARWLEASGLFESVWDVRSVVPPALLLEGAIVDLYADYRASGPPVAVLSLSFALLDVQQVPPAVVFHDRYHAEVPAADDSTDALVAAWNAALRELLARFEADLGTRGLRP